MLVPTLALMQIARKWRDIFAEDSDIQEWYFDKYDVLPKIFVGLDVRNGPKEDDCPYIAIIPGNKVEGLFQDNYHYNMSLGWVIKQEHTTIITGTDETSEIEEFDGIAECDEIGQILLSKIIMANSDYPLTEINYDISLTEHQPQYVGSMDITIEVPRTIGVEIEY
ncbi:MAG: hypothetical protein H6Q67_1616 [Firmicutes bacterium]|nr:hypothetical protein [Bacillota bacterium]